MNFIGIDIGTSSICGVVLDARRGKLLASLTLPNNAWLPARHPWERMQNPAGIVATALKIVDSLSGQVGNAAGIGVTGQMHGILYVDAHGRSVSPLFTWQDERGGQVVKKSMTYADVLARLTGYTLAPGFGLVTHFYNLKNGRVPRATASLCTIADYVGMRLAHQRHPSIDPTNAASLGIFDLRNLCFDANMIGSARLRTGLLPRLVPTGTKIGATPAGIPVYAAPGDNQASMLGSVRDVKRSLVVNIGTGGQISAWMPSYQRIHGLDLRPFPGGGYIAVGAALCGGKAYALLERFFREVCLRFTGAAPKDLYAIMNKLDAAAAEPLSIDTRFSGTRRDPSIRGTIAGISMSNFTPGRLVDGFLRGMVEELNAFYRLMPPKTRRQMRVLVGSGNGLRLNRRLCTVVEQVFGMRVNIPAHCEEAATGAALTAAVGAGCFRNYSEAGKIIKHRKSQNFPAI
ncbi:MAG: FGGY family carbohydrate kinase [Kiritimatiellaeota bacterium]|nr:FGGY family carbohydrate kinase [Kiritimatiellota bacterium]